MSVWPSLMLVRFVISTIRSRLPLSLPAVCNGLRAPSVCRSPFGFACDRRSHKKCCFFFHFRCTEWDRSGVPSPLNIPKDNTLFDCFVTDVLCCEKFNVKRTYCRFDPSVRVSRISPIWPATWSWSACLNLFHPIIHLGAIRFGPGCGWSLVGVRRSPKVLPGTYSSALNAPTYVSYTHRYFRAPFFFFVSAASTY